MTDDLHDRVAEFRGMYPYYADPEPDLEPYHELLDDYDTAEVLQAFKDGGFGTTRLHRHMDMVLLAALGDEATATEFLNTTRWYE